MPAAWKILSAALSAARRIPPEQRRRMMVSAGKTARKHGPTVAREVGKGIGAVVKQVRKTR